MTTSDPLRTHLARALDWAEAHAGLDKGIDGIPAEKRGALAPGFEHSLWQMLEHMRLAQKDILDFCVNPKYVHSLNWPDDYWPRTPAPPKTTAWDESVAEFRADLEKMKEVARDVPDLFALVPTGKDRQTYLRSILLVLDHNSYHLGQMIAVRKALGAWA